MAKRRVSCSVALARTKRALLESNELLGECAELLNKYVSRDDKRATKLRNLLKELRRASK